MENYQRTNLPTSVSQSPSIHGSSWQNINNILLNDGDIASLAYITNGDSGASITTDDYGFSLPPSAVIDGIKVTIDGTNIGCSGSVAISISGTTPKDIGALNGDYGSSTDLWGAAEIAPADIATINVTVDTADVSGGDGLAGIDYMEVTIYWHIDPQTEPADVPTRITYKVWSRAGRFLGELPEPTTDFAFAQDINSPATTIHIECATNIDTGVVTEPLLTEDGDVIQTEDGQDILATMTQAVIARGNSPDEVLFKNGNRIKVWVSNKWYPNGKLMFSGQINRIGLRYGDGATVVQLTVISDGLDLSNLIARGFPFNYTTDVSQAVGDDNRIIAANDKGASFLAWGQSFKTGASVNNIGAINIGLNGAANITLSLYDAPNGNLLASVTRAVNTTGWEVIQFAFPQLVAAIPLTDYFFGGFVDPGQNILISNSAASVYADGSMYSAAYGGGSGGGTFTIETGDLYFETAYGVPTTTTTFSTQDPITDMTSDVLADYNSRGGLITERNFAATGLSLTYTFNMATIFDVIKKALDLSPTGYYAYIDLGYNKIDMLPMSETADFILTRGVEINKLDLSLSIEQVKNYLLFTGGEVSGANLFREYPDPQSAAAYGPRYVSKSDNRVILDATANAIGETFIEENSSETQETSITILNEAIDISLLTPGKTVGFRNFGNLADNMILPIVRREPNFKVGYTTLTLGRLPVRMNDEIQRINRELQNEQTANNPSSPT